MHGLQACLFKYIILLLHSTFMLCVVKMPLNWEIGGSSLIVMEITSLIMENHGKIMELCVFF